MKKISIVRSVFFTIVLFSIMHMIHEYFYKKNTPIQSTTTLELKNKNQKEIRSIGNVLSIKVPETGDVLIVSKKSLRESRNDFKTKIVAKSFKDSGRIMTPPEDVFILTKYPTKLGEMSTYVTPDPRDGKRHPAVIWIPGGYGGLSDSEDFFWRDHSRDNDQSASAFRNAGLVVMIPSFRGEDKNPGRYEMFYGELDDIESAFDWLSKQTYVDPARIYLAGHSTGGTRVLLASEYSQKFRAYFSIGGMPDLKARVKLGNMQVKIPFQQTSNEYKLRSPARFIRSIKKPTWYFEGEEAYWDTFDEFATIAEKENIPLVINKIKSGDHFNIIAPLTELIAEKILADVRAESNIIFSDDDLAKISYEIDRK